ncbi:MAG: hypothetical protein P4L55_04045 [Syntrophobacteraceae bacterium]|nr:hypothetical protein [Syntrophobacteraceae bacterium]
MSVDFCDAAYRHFNDAKRLFDNDRMANADHLTGIAAECALKAVMVGLGMNLGAGMSPNNVSTGFT